MSNASKTLLTTEDDVHYGSRLAWNNDLQGEHTYYKALFFGTACDIPMFVDIPMQVHDTSYSDIKNLNIDHWMTLNTQGNVPLRRIILNAMPGTDVYRFNHAISVFTMPQSHSMPINRLLARCTPSLTKPDLLKGNILVIKHDHYGESMRDVNYFDAGVISSALISGIVHKNIPTG